MSLLKDRRIYRGNLRVLVATKDGEGCINLTTKQGKTIAVSINKQQAVNLSKFFEIELTDLDKPTNDKLNIVR